MRSTATTSSLLPGAALLFNYPMCAWSTAHRLSPLNKRPSTMTCAHFVIGMTRRQLTGGFLKPFEHQQCRIVPYNPEKYFNVVLDVEKYKSFIPWCQESSVCNIPLNGNPCSFSAEVVIGFKLFKERYTSIVTYNRPNLIQVSAIDSSIFSKLVNEWKFSPGPDSNSAIVDFRIEFQNAEALFLLKITFIEFSNILHQQAAGFFMEELTSVMTSSFDDRVAALYGGKTLSNLMESKPRMKQDHSLLATGTELLQPESNTVEVLNGNTVRKDILPCSGADDLKIREKENFMNNTSDSLFHWSDLLLRVQSLVDQNKLSPDLHNKQYFLFD
ncbi:polyketide cyclase/dehydrase [Cardiosporidium cionae]|uniref:Polyketide cyclase/dehydrase n=1 Tax=Cardiosporidium cionae TaxID=476202 RepID=A0ABQ7JCE8_9APIC|nr:polyketide cyclase/dehydrase [Cardiosporidium cionae]|eukprot:KAF8821675.1 polyketide cyclase/dehydrase [Cardiosporidium cionae]